METWSLISSNKELFPSSSLFHNSWSSTFSVLDFALSISDKLGYLSLILQHRENLNPPSGVLHKAHQEELHSLLELAWANWNLFQNFFRWKSPCCKETGILDAWWSCAQFKFHVTWVSHSVPIYFKLSTCLPIDLTLFAIWIQTIKTAFWYSKSSMLNNNVKASPTLDISMICSSQSLCFLWWRAWILDNNHIYIKLDSNQSPGVQHWPRTILHDHGELQLDLLQLLGTSDQSSFTFLHSQHVNEVPPKSYPLHPCKTSLAPTTQQFTPQWHHWPDHRTENRPHRLSQSP